VPQLAGAPRRGLDAGAPAANALSRDCAVGSRRHCSTNARAVRRFSGPGRDAIWVAGPADQSSSIVGVRPEEHAVDHEQRPAVGERAAVIERAARVDGHIVTTASCPVGLGCRGASP